MRFDKSNKPIKSSENGYILSEEEAAYNILFNY